MNIRTAETREQRKARTRQDLMDAALRLLEDQSFSGLSLREVAREAGVVPTAFYRHFENMQALGLALIDESFRTLREMIRSARSDPSMVEHAISSSVEILVRYVREHRLQFRFVARERYSGVPALRSAIRAEIRLFASELATDLGRFRAMKDWTTEDLQVMAGLIVNSMVSIVEEILDTPPNDPAAEAEVRRLARKQLRMIVLSAPAWQSNPAD